MTTPLRFLVDVGVGRAAEARLATLGHDTVAVRDRNPRLPDSDILEWAAADDRIVVTMDRDFGDLVFQSSAGHAGVLLLRMHDLTGLDKADALERIVSDHGAELPGRFAVYQDGRLRVRET